LYGAWTVAIDLVSVKAVSSRSVARFLEPQTVGRVSIHAGSQGSTDLLGVLGMYAAVLDGRFNHLPGDDSFGRLFRSVELLPQFGRQQLQAVGAH
jgi:hypothetical protein